MIEKLIKNNRGVKKCNDDVKRLDKESQRKNFRRLLGFKENDIYESKEYSVVREIKKVFKRKKMIDQYRVEKYFIDLFFPVHNLGVEIDKNGHTDRTGTKGKEREETIKNNEITLIRINPDKENFDIFDEISKNSRFYS